MLAPDKAVETIEGSNGYGFGGNVETKGQVNNLGYASGTGSASISGRFQSHKNNVSIISKLATVSITNLTIDYATFQTWGNIEGGIERMTIYAQDKETFEVEVIAENYPLIPDRSYIISPAGNIELQKYGYGHFINDIGRNQFPGFMRRGTSNNDYCQNDCARRGWKANWCMSEHDTWQYCSPKHGYDAYDRNCSTDCDFYGEAYKYCYVDEQKSKWGYCS